MGYFANISGSLVIEHFTGETIPTSSGNWVSHSFAHVDVGFTYDSDLEVFYPPQPYPSFTLDKTTQMWDPPVPYPSSSQNEIYNWNEETQTWYLT
mgnify:CR=1 FL=1